MYMYIVEIQVYLIGKFGMNVSVLVSLDQLITLLHFV